MGTGMAPGARLAFMDLSSANSDVVLAPYDYGEGYASNTYDVGARIHSGACGAGAGAHSLGCMLGQGLGAYQPLPNALPSPPDVAPAHSTPELRLASAHSLGSPQPAPSPSPPLSPSPLLPPPTRRRLAADSWGSDVISYDGSAASLDAWAYENPEFVATIAAGNYGESDGVYKWVAALPAPNKLTRFNLTPACGSLRQRPRPLPALP
jgi:hypothetical protein